MGRQVDEYKEVSEYYSLWQAQRNSSHCNSRLNVTAAYELSS